MFNEFNYLKRLIDDKINDLLRIFGGVLIQSPKWCGKTWTGLYHSKSSINLSNRNIFDLVNLNIEYISTKIYPILIDEWQLIPKVWDYVRFKIDENSNNNFILTCSTSYKLISANIKHSGTGRIIIINMFTMSLYESQDTNNEVSILNDLYENKNINHEVNELKINELLRIILRGGRPKNIKNDKDYRIIPSMYANSIIENESLLFNKNPILMKKYYVN